MTTVAPSLVLTPHGHLRLAPSPDAQPLSEDLQQRLTAAFDRGTGQGLLQLGGGEVATALPAVFAYWREFAVRYVTAVCTSAQAAEGAVIAAPDNLSAIAAAVPPMAGAEYLTEAVLQSLWQDLELGLGACLADDMGLGKTIQVLSLLLVLKRQEQEAAGRNEERSHRPCAV